MGHRTDTFQNLTAPQRTILAAVTETPYVRDQFYFTGGTLLHSYYMNHRYSDDLDFFTENPLDTAVIETYIEQWSTKHQFTYRAQFVDVVYIFILSFPDGSELKVDFAQYPHKPLEERKQIGGIRIDGLRDIAVNKLVCIQQRTDVKDFVDLYYLLKEFSIWTISYGLKEKYNMIFEPIYTAADMLKILDLDTMPRMISPLTIEELQIFFTAQAKELGHTAVRTTAEE